MNPIKIRPTSYAYAGQTAWLVDAGLPYPLFYMVESAHPGGLWHARSSLGRGYTSGSVCDRLYVRDVKAKTIREAAPKLLRLVAKGLREQAAKDLEIAHFLETEADQGFST